MNILEERIIGTPYRDDKVKSLNFRGKTAVESILPDTLQEFLDEDCISGKGVITAEEFSITFDYGFLAPPLLNEKMALPSDEQEVS